MTPPQASWNSWNSSLFLIPCMPPPQASWKSSLFLRHDAYHAYMSSMEDSGDAIDATFRIVRGCHLDKASVSEACLPSSMGIAGMPHRSSHFSCCAHSRTPRHPGAPPHRTPHRTTRQGLRGPHAPHAAPDQGGRVHTFHRFEVGSNSVCETVSPGGTLQPTCSGMQGAPITAAEHSAPLIPIQMLTLCPIPAGPLPLVPLSPPPHPPIRWASTTTQPSCWRA